MEANIPIPFQQLLRFIKALTPAQKAEVRRELEAEALPNSSDDEFLNLLLNGPVYSDADVAIIEENHKSVAAWRTGN